MKRRSSLSDTIVRASFVSVEASTLESNLEEGRHHATMVFTFRVHEYLMGSGGNTIKAIVVSAASNATEVLAERAAEQCVATRDTTYEDRQAILFLLHETGDTYYLGAMRGWGGGRLLESPTRR